MKCMIYVIAIEYLVTLLSNKIKQNVRVFIRKKSEKMNSGKYQV